MSSQQGDIEKSYARTTEVIERHSGNEIRCLPAKLDVSLLLPIGQQGENNMAPGRCTSRDRMLAALKREGPEYVPFSTYIVQGAWYRGPLYWRHQFERALRLLEMDLDPTIDIWLPLPTPAPAVKIKTWREKKGSEVLLTKEFHTPAGVLRQVIREPEDWTSALHTHWIPTIFGTEKREEMGMHLFDDQNVPRRVEPWVKGKDDLPKLRYLMLPPEGHLLDEWRMDVERALEFAQKHQLATLVRRTITGDAHQWLCDIPWFLTQLYEDQAFAEEFLGIFQAWSKKMIELVLEFQVDIIQYRGCYEQPSYWGLKSWQKFLAPLIDEQAQLVHNAGRLFSYMLMEGHNIYADTLAEMKTDVLQAIDPLTLGRGTLAELFAKLGDSKSFWGGVNAEVTLASADRERIEKEVKGTIQALGGRGGLIISAFTFADLPEQSILWMIEAWRKYRHWRA